MAGGGKTKIGTDSGQGFIRIAEEALCFLRFFFQDEVGQRFSRFLLEFPGEIGAIQKQILCYFFLL